MLRTGCSFQTTRLRFLFLATIACIFIVSFFGVTSANVQQAHATNAACSSSASAQNGITVVPSHGKAFYIDTGVTPVLDAGYIGYRVTNSTGSTQSDLWTEVSGFSGGKLLLVNSDDSTMQLSSLSNTSTGTSYFLLKATGATTTAQTHTVKVYNHRPDLSNASLLYTCDFTFSKVQETIKAASNKLANNGLNSSAAIEASDTSPELGQLISITVEGQTGNIGAGSAPDYDIIWLTPAAVSSWPTRSLRLESVSALFDGNGNWGTTGDQTTYTNQLLISSANGSSIDGSEYRFTYNFRVIGRPTSTVKVVPVSQIASGSQVKHSDTGASGATLDLVFSSLAINATLTKSVTSLTGLTTVTCGGSCSVPGGINGETYVAVPYRLTAESSTATTLVMDDVVDTPGDGIIFKPDSATVTDIGRSAVAIADPVYISSESSVSPRPYHFIGPFTLNTSTSATINYTMWVPVGSHANTSYAMIGDLKIGATASASSRVTVTSTGTATVGVTVDTVGFSVDAATVPATDITSSAVTLNGTVDPNGTAVLTGQFQHGTSPTLANATTVTATTPTNGTLNALTDPTSVSVGLTGLSSGTTYYYRVIAGDAQGAILSFITLAVLAAPTVTTNAATAVSTTAATLNGTINPNLTSITGIQFIYGTSSLLASGNTTATQDDGSGLAALTIAGSTAQAFSQDWTGLTVGTTYYFKIRACTSALTGTYPNVTCSSFTDGSILSFVAISVPTVTTSVATSVGDTTATLNGSVNANGASSSVSFEYGTVADLSSGTTTVSYGNVAGSTPTGVNSALSSLSSGTTYYFRAIATNSAGTTNGSILSFITSSPGLISRTISIDESSFTSTYTMIASAPTLTSTASEGTGTKTYSSSTTSVCTINASTGAITFVGAGNCSVYVSIAADATYDTATSSSISFSITLASRTLAIDEGSYVSSYTTTSTPPTITSTVSAGAGTKSYTSSTTGVCIINVSSGVASFVSAGTCTIGASISATSTYSSADASTISFSVTLSPRTISIDAESFTSTYTMIASAPTLTSTASAGDGTKSFTSSTTGVCTVNTSTGAITFVAIGTCHISVTIAASSTHAEAISEEISFSITLAPRTLAIDGSSYLSTYTTTSTPPTITSTTSAGVGTKSYTSSTTSVCTVHTSSGVVTFVSAETCTLQAHVSATDVYLAATSESISFILSAPFTGGVSASTPMTLPSISPIRLPFVGEIIPVRNTTPPPTSESSAGIAKSVPSDTVSENQICKPYLTKFIRFGENNDPAEVRKLQSFLNQYENEQLIADGVYKPVDVDAVMRFQVKHKEILAFWNSTKPTGYVYIATQKSVNQIVCSRNNPLTCPYFTKYVKEGSRNSEVVKIKQFLNATQGERLDLKDTLFDKKLTSAVRRFQAKNMQRVLGPWGLKSSTGWWYKSTRKMANDLLGCFASVTLDNGTVLQ